MLKIIQLILVVIVSLIIVIIPDFGFSQNKLLNKSWFIGSQYNNITLSENDFSLTSFHIGKINSWQYDSKALKDQKIKNIRYNVLYSFQIDRFGERGFYQVVKNNDVIEYTKFSFIADLEWSLLEINWPKKTNFFVRTGVILSPLIIGRARVNNKQYYDSITPQFINGRFGIGLQMQVNRNSYLSIQSVTTMFSDFYDEDIGSAKDLVIQVFDGKFPKLRSILLSYRMVISAN